jgi:hypothetical protein
MSYFNNFPLINYFDKQSRSIILKAALIADVVNKADAFYPYIIKDYDRADTIAYEQYQDSGLDWVVYFSNNIVDPFYNWPLTYEQFRPYIEKKYNKTIYQLQSEVSHYKYTGITNDTAEDIARKSWLMSPTTHTYIDDTSGWTAVSIYDYENELNEEKRSIKLLNSVYIPQLQKEITTIFKNL